MPKLWILLKMCGIYPIRNLSKLCSWFGARNWNDLVGVRLHRNVMQIYRNVLKMCNVSSSYFIKSIQVYWIYFYGYALMVGFRIKVLVGMLIAKMARLPVIETNKPLIIFNDYVLRDKAVPSFRGRGSPRILICHRTFSIIKFQ